jgi:hypothetical protein
MTAQTAISAVPADPRRPWARAAKFLWLNTFARGFIGALSAITLLADVVGLESYEAARAIHTLVVGWSVVADQIGALVGQLPFIPDLSAATVNTIVFMGTVTIPALFGIRKFMGPVSVPGLPTWLRWSINWAAPLMLGYIFIFGTIVFQGGDPAALQLKQPVPVHDSLLPFISEGQRLSLFAISIVMQFVIAGWLKPFRMGLFTFAGVIAAAELLYFAPFVGPHVRAWTDGILGGQVL